MMTDPLSDTYAAVLTGVNHRYPAQPGNTLSNIDLAIEQGEVVSLIGPSGAGKSTLLSLLDGRLRNWRGAVSVLGHALDPRQTPARQWRADTGFIFQEFALVERASVYRNILNGRLGRIGTLASLFNHFSDQDHLAVVTAMRDAGIADLASRRADHLSGGQRQRVAIARCLAQQPKLILADEPVSNLDPTHASQLLELLLSSARARGASLIFSSHQPALARRYADRIIALREGEICFDATPGELGEQQVNEVYHQQSPAKARLRLVG